VRRNSISGRLSPNANPVKEERSPDLTRGEEETEIAEAGWRREETSFLNKSWKAIANEGGVKFSEERGKIQNFNSSPLRSSFTEEIVNRGGVCLKKDEVGGELSGQGKKKKTSAGKTGGPLAQKRCKLTTSSVRCKSGLRCQARFTRRIKLEQYNKR